MPRHLQPAALTEVPLSVLRVYQFLLRGTGCGGYPCTYPRPGAMVYADLVTGHGDGMGCVIGQGLGRWVWLYRSGTHQPAGFLAWPGGHACDMPPPIAAIGRNAMNPFTIPPCPA